MKESGGARPPDPGDDAAAGVTVDAALLDRMTDAFFALDGDWRFTYLNERGREVIAEAIESDLDGDDLVGAHIWESIPSAVDTEFHDRYREAMRTGTPQEFEAFYEPLDTWFDVRAYPSPTGLSVLFRDVTGEKRRIERLAAREGAFRAFSEAISEPDRSFEERVDALMEIGCDVFDTEYGTLSRVRDDRYVFEAVCAPDDSVAPGDEVDLSTTNCERVVLTEEALVLGDVDADAPDLADRAGNAEWGISCYLGAPVTVEGSVYGTFCFYDREPRTEPFADWQVMLVELMAEWVSSALERRVVEEDLRRQNERLEEFAAIVSHDLRNPLAVARGRTELAAESAEGTDEHLETVRRAHDRMDRIVSDMLTMARTGRAVEETEPVDLAAAAATAWATVDTAGATLDAGGAPAVLADGGRLTQLFENLFRNSVEHSSTGGRTSPRDGDGAAEGEGGVRVTVEAIPGGFAVADDGPGVPPDEREAVFEHGHTSREEGTGFGLSIVRDIAEAHGWTVTLGESDEGGARFEFADVEPA